MHFPPCCNRFTETSAQPDVLTNRWAVTSVVGSIRTDRSFLSQCLDRSFGMVSRPPGKAARIILPMMSALSVIAFSIAPNMPGYGSRIVATSFQFDRCSHASAHAPAITPHVSLSLQRKLSATDNIDHRNRSKSRCCIIIMKNETTYLPPYQRRSSYVVISQTSRPKGTSVHRSSRSRQAPAGGILTAK